MICPPRQAKNSNTSQTMQRIAQADAMLCGRSSQGTYREGTYREVSMLLSRSVKAITTTNRAIGSVGYAARVLPMFQH
jgi:hypothetical protein